MLLSFWNLSQWISRGVILSGVDQHEQWKKTWMFRVYRGIILPHLFQGIRINHYKDPNKTISIKESKAGYFSWLIRDQPFEVWFHSFTPRSRLGQQMLLSQTLGDLDLEFISCGSKVASGEHFPREKKEHIQSPSSQTAVPQSCQSWLQGCLLGWALLLKARCH